jgi:putative sensor protein
MSRPAPRTIDEYLAALRAELAGQDPALIQDALYDASEYLRAEVAAHHGTPEAEVLERVMSTYGRPEEIAVAYRDTELTVTQALHPPASRRSSSPNPLDRFFAVYSDPRAYMSLFFMFLSLATGIVYFIFALTGLALSLGLAILIVGLPVFIAFLGIARVISLGEGRLLEAVSGERMPRRPAQLPPRGGLWGRIRTMLRDARTWTTVGYLHLMLPLGVVYFVFATTALSLGVSLLLVPLVGIAQRLEWWPWAPQRIAISPAWLDTPAGWIVCIVFGPLVLTGLLHVARTVVAAHARVAKALLVS